uniref:6-phosphofructo-2-kinase/fructose-2,6-bisphosphat ase n=1 Tax=Cacopsylla melanoneura TaxID=428564 RepID=A0A8D8VTU4_9HEMI
MSPMSPKKGVYRASSESSDDEVTGGRYRTDSGTFESDHSDLEDDCKKGINERGLRQFTPLVVVLVGLPARGKTILAHKLSRYLTWTDHKAKVFSVSAYRRMHQELYNSHDMFRAGNKEGYNMRQLSAREAQEDATKWLKNDGEVAIIDGTTATIEKRKQIHDFFARKMGFKVLFVELIVQDEEILEHNIKEMIQFNKDYKNMSEDKALDDFQHKMEHFLEVYETINPKLEARYSYVKVYDGGENMNVRFIDGPLQSEVLSYISNFRPTPKTFYFSRHGESEFNVLGRIGGDADLSPRGRMYAAALARHFNEAEIPDLHMWTSEKRRTKQTVAGINATSEAIPALNELDAGVCEGYSYEEMQDKFPQEFAWRDQDKLRYRYPWGESYVDIMHRIRPVLLELEREDNLLVVSHQAVLRCLLGYFLNKKPDELPYMNVPLHTIIKLTTSGYKTQMEVIKLNIACVDTYRQQPKDCSALRSTQEALHTVPAHYDSLNIWNGQLPNLIEQN